MPDRLRADPRAAAMARKYVWWQSPARTLRDQRLLPAQIMTLGTADDARWLVSRVPAADLRRILSDPPVGVFNRRSWVFWRRRLGLDPAAPLPARRLPSRLLSSGPSCMTSRGASTGSTPPGSGKCSTSARR